MCAFSDKHMISVFAFFSILLYLLNTITMTQNVYMCKFYCVRRIETISKKKKTNLIESNAMSYFFWVIFVQYYLVQL